MQGLVGVFQGPAIVRAHVQQIQGLLGDVDLAGLAGLLHLVRDDDVARPDVILPLVDAQDAGDYVTGVHADAHVDVDAALALHALAHFVDDVDHVQAWKIGGEV